MVLTTIHLGAIFLKQKKKVVGSFQEASAGPGVVPASKSFP